GRVAVFTIRRALPQPLQFHGRFLVDGHDAAQRPAAGLFGLLAVTQADLGRALDVDAPARELGGQAGVLALAADGQRQLVVGHDDLGHLLLGGEGDVHHPRRAQRVGHVALGIFVPVDDVALLTLEFVDHRLHAAAPRADAGAHWVDALSPRRHGHLGAGARLAGDGLDLHVPLVNLRDLQLEQPLQQPRMAAGQHDLGALGGLAHFHDVSLDPLAGAVQLPGNLLGGQQDGLAAAQVHEHVAAHHPADHPGDDVALAADELLVNQVALGLPQPLHDHLLGGLGGNAAEVAGRDLDLGLISDLVRRVDLAGLVQRDLLALVLDLLHHPLAGDDPDLAGFPVQAHDHV